MYFDIHPKAKREDLFGMDYSANSLISYLSDDSTRMVIIKGLRRTGKTSLLNVVLSESKINSVKIDVRESPYYDRKEFLNFLINKIRQKVGEPLINKIIRKISGVGINYKDLSFSVFLSKEENLNLFFENFNKQLAQEKKKFVLAFDEVQLLKVIKLDFIFASIFDNYTQIKLLLTGSEIGLLDRFIGKKHYEAPLFGRAYIEIETRKLREEDMALFLEKGFQQINKKINLEEIKDVIENLDGIIGWVTQYGWFRNKGFSVIRALENVKESGKEIVKREINSFLDTRKAKVKYMKVLKYLSHGNNSWSLLKYGFEKDSEKIMDNQLNLYLKELLDYGFIEKKEDKYFISDPMTVEVVR